MKCFFAAALAAACAIVALPANATASTLDKVRAAGVVKCGAFEDGPGLAMIESNGSWSGFFPDICQAIAAAVVGNPDRIQMVSITLANGFNALTAGAVDVLVHRRTWTLHRDADQRQNFPVLYLFDGMSFMSHRSEGVASLDDLRGKTVCVSKDSTTEAHARYLSAARKLDLGIEVFETIQSTYSSFFSRECTVVADDAMGLAANRATAGADGADYVILPDRPFKEPLFPVVRKDDDAWSDVVRWVVNAMIAAEELGISSANIEAEKASADPAIRHFLGLQPGLGAGLGLDAGWTVRVIKAVGNYGELYERNIGAGSPLTLERGLNRLWNQGGVMWSPPFD